MDVVSFGFMVAICTSKLTFSAGGTDTEDLNKAIGRAVEVFANLAKSIVELAKSIANILFPVLKSNNWRKLHGLPMRRRRRPCGKRKIHTWNT